MIWRIFRKDCGQLWLLVTLVAMAQLSNATLWFYLAHFREPRGLVTLAEVFAVAILLGMVALIAAVVHEDILPGVSQDWLVRPIRRRDLLCAKLLFIIVVVQGPALLADLGHGMAAGFAFRDSLTAALTRELFMLLVFDLPLLAIAAITSTLVQVAASVLGIWVAVVVGILGGVVVRHGAPPPFASSGIQWMTPAFWSLLAFSAAIVIVPLQYFRRATSRSRQILVGAVLVTPMLSFSSWASVFSIQRWLSPNPAIAEPIAFAFDPTLGESTAELASTPANTLLLPLRVSGLPPDSIVMNDRAEVRLTDRVGATLFRGRTTSSIGYGDDFPVETTEGGDVRTYQRIMLPGSVYELVGKQPVGMEIDYSLTLFHLAAAHTIAAVNGSDRFGVFGWCKTKLDDDGDDIELGCIKTGAAPTCVIITLENPTNGKRNPENRYCDPDYAPYSPHFYPDSMSQVDFGIRFRDLQHLAKFPVDGSQLADAKVILKSYRPEAHFTRSLVIREIRPSDWTPNGVDDETRPR